MKQKRAKIGFTGCAKAYIRSLQEEGRYSTAHVYKNAVLSFTRFHGSTYIAFEQITRESLRRYGQYLYCLLYTSDAADEARRRLPD